LLDMTRIVALLLLVLSTMAVPAVASAIADDSVGNTAHVVAAQEEGPSEDSPGEPWGEVVIWSIVALGIFAAIGGALHYFKRQVGGFPENPGWVAPITIMQSKDFPDEGDFGDQVPSHQAHAEH
jgi:hypothetical protein